MLRITAGEHRGRKLKVPEVKATRPLVERARQAFFDHLGDTVENAVVWDVYAGSGILGSVALSRGAQRVFAVEIHPRAAKQLRENAEMLGCSERVQVRRMDVGRFLDTEPETPQILFFDPPYKDFDGPQREAVWELFCRMAGCLSPGGCAVVHTSRGILSTREMDCLPGLERRDYGTTSLYWWHAPPPA